MLEKLPNFKLAKMPKMSYKIIYSNINIVLLHTAENFQVLCFSLPLK